MTEEVLSRARQRLVAVYSNKHDEFSDTSLDAMRAYKFLNNRSTLLKLLPPTEDALLQHVRRAALATLTAKTSHIPNPTAVAVSEYGWSLVDNKPVPVMSTQPAWPQEMKNAVSCRCNKGCTRNCSCTKNNIQCYVGCRCGGSVNRCRRAHPQCEGEESELDEQ